MTLSTSDISLAQTILANGPFPGAVAQQVRNVRNTLSTAPDSLSGTDALFLLRMTNSVNVPGAQIDAFADLQDALTAIVTAAGLTASSPNVLPGQPPRPPTLANSAMPGQSGQQPAVNTPPQINSAIAAK